MTGLQEGIADLIHLKAELQWLDECLMQKETRDDTDWEDRALILELIAQQEEDLDEVMSWKEVGIEFGM